MFPPNWSGARVVLTFYPMAVSRRTRGEGDPMTPSKARAEQEKKEKCKGHTCRWRFPKEIQPLALA